MSIEIYLSLPLLNQVIFLNIVDFLISFKFQCYFFPLLERKICSCSEVDHEKTSSYDVEVYQVQLSIVHHKLESKLIETCRRSLEDKSKIVSLWSSNSLYLVIYNYRWFLSFPSQQIQLDDWLQSWIRVEPNSWAFHCKISCWHIFYYKSCICSFLCEVFDSILIGPDLLNYIGKIDKSTGSGSLSNINIDISILERVKEYVNYVVEVSPRVWGLRVDNNIFSKSLYFWIIAGYLPDKMMRGVL